MRTRRLDRLLDAPLALGLEHPRDLCLVLVVPAKVAEGLFQLG